MYREVFLAKTVFEKAIQLLQVLDTCSYRRALELALISIRKIGENSQFSVFLTVIFASTT
jgi:hypothetical protein